MQIKKITPRSANQFKTNYLLTYLRIWAPLEEPLTGQPLKNFPAFHGTRRSNTVFTRVLHWSLSWDISIQSTPSHPISLTFILIFSTHLRPGLPRGLFHSGFPTSILYALLFSPILLILGEEYKLWRGITYLQHIINSIKTYSRISAKRLKLCGV
jgi:hypothetical protein